MSQNDGLDTFCNPSNLLYEVTGRCKWWPPRSQEGLGKKPPRFAGPQAAKAPSIPDNWIGHGLDEDWTRMDSLTARGVLFHSRPEIAMNRTIMRFLFNIYSVTDSWIIVQKNGFVRDGIVH